jgi:hypothetical protein
VAFAGIGEILVDGCEMIFQPLVKILIHAVEQFGFLRLKLRNASVHGRAFALRASGSAAR